MRLLRQIAAFGTVGLLATLVHVGVAWMLMEKSAIGALAANTCGAAAAFVISYLGNARITFINERGLMRGAARYAIVSLTSLVLSSGISFMIERNGLPAYLYVVLVLAIVPPTTFLLARLWAFQPLPRQAVPD